MRRFGDFQRNIGVARNILSDRLNTLVAEGILRRELYNEHPPRYEYRLTRKGIDLYGILIELMKWGNRWSPNEEGPAVILRHRDCGQRDRARAGLPRVRRERARVESRGAARPGDDRASRGRVRCATR